MSASRLSGHLLSGALALALGAHAHAALIVNDALEGAWYNAAEAGRGALVDYIPSGPGAGTLFIAIFTYDAQGNPLWLTTQTVVNEGEFSWTNMPVLRFNGGTFGSPFTAPSNAALGTASVSFNSCSDLRINFTPAAGTTLPATSYTFDRPAAVPNTCVYRQPFTACPTGTTAVAGAARTCKINSPVTGDVRLSNAATYLIDGPTRVGQGRNTGPGRLFIEPGTLISGSGTTLSYLAVQPGSKIYAQGQSFAPVVFTGPTPTNGSWAGLVIAGNAQCNASQDGTPCTFEAVASQQFGGSANTESSGILEYVQVRYAGQEVRPNEELNSITMLGVGSGTIVSNVQIYGGKDDGIEFFGGTVNLKNLVMLGVEDDSLDFDLGYQGRIQYAYVRQVPSIGVIGTDSNGIESDNHPNSFDLLPRTRPAISNFTLIGGAGGNEGIRLRRGSGATYFKGLVVGFAAEGLNFNDNATFTVAGTPQALGTELTMRDMYLSNTTNFEDSSAEPYLVSQWYSAGNNNRVGANPLSGSTPFPTGTTLNLTTPYAPDLYFEATDYIGAFSSADDNWAAGWTYDFR
ncbi:MAG: hypothetical protein U1F26_13965 [Lysobacterales bacterium]